LAAYSGVLAPNLSRAIMPELPAKAGGANLFGIELLAVATEEIKGNEEIFLALFVIGHQGTDVAEFDR
jgi:hypothetical protein